MSASDSRSGSRDGSLAPTDPERARDPDAGAHRRYPAALPVSPDVSPAVSESQVGDESSGRSYRPLLTTLLVAPFLFSMLVHVIGLLGMALIVVPPPGTVRPTAIVCFAPDDDAVIDEHEPFDFEEFEIK